MAHIMSFWKAILLAYFIHLSSTTKLTIQGTHFVYDGKHVFLSGINKAWQNYAYDFGNGQYNGVKADYEAVLQQIHNAGANSLRVWVHLEGETSPMFNNAGMVVGLDSGGTFLSDMKELLTAAQKYDIFIFLTLWNGAVKQSTHYRLDGLIKDTAKLQSYIDKALKPMAAALKDMAAFGGWDLMNEPEGELIPNMKNGDPCLDTQYLSNSGAGWAGKLYTAQEMQRFINWQADAIKQIDPQALISVGVWSGQVITDQFGYHDLYKDKCLINAGGKNNGTLTFYQVHSYDWNGKFGSDSPFMHEFADFGVNKPIVIGEFNEKSGAGKTIEQLYDHAYQHGYAGGWAWSQMDGNMTNMMKGVSHIRSYNDPVNGTISVVIQ